MVLRSVAIVVLAVAGNLGLAQSTIQPQDRVREDITESNMVKLSGNVHPALARAVSEASVDANFPMEHMILLLQPDEAQQAALEQLVAQQHDPHSSQFHKFLMPEQFAARFGVSQNDIDKITGWLSQHGFQVEEVTANHLSIVFSGDAYAVQNAFKTEVKQSADTGGARGRCERRGETARLSRAIFFAGLAGHRRWSPVAVYRKPYHSLSGARRLGHDL
jgi:hypothetical protein